MMNWSMSMNLLAIIGSPRKKHGTDTLVTKAIEGVKMKLPDVSVKKIYLADHKISHCKDCLSCWSRDAETPIAKCVIRDDMDEINRDILNADAIIMGTPIHMGYSTALVMTFLERICWTFAKPAKSYILVKGCPAPRSEKKRKAVIIAVSGMIPTKYKKLCNWATPQIKGVMKDSLNAQTVGELYAGDLWHTGIEKYFTKAQKLGEKLV